MPRNEQVLAADPKHGDANLLLGVIAYQMDNHALAVSLIKTAILSIPNSAKAHFHLGNALKGLGRLDEAVDSYRKALSLKPDFAEAFYNMGVTFE